MVILLQIGLASQYAEIIQETKIYIVDYPGFDHQVIEVQKDDLKVKLLTLFTLRSIIYLAFFRQDTVTFYTFDIMSNNSLVYLQELKHPLISDFSGLEYLTLPFYS